MCKNITRAAMSICVNKKQASILFRLNKLNKNHIRFLNDVGYINQWQTWDDCKACMFAYQPDFEKLYDHYEKTGYIPYFSPMVISFVYHINLFIKSNKNRMYIVTESLMREWQSAKFIMSTTHS